MEPFEFTNIYYRELPDEGDSLQVVFVNKKQPGYALAYSFYEFYYVSVLDTGFSAFKEFTTFDGKSYSNIITGARNNDSTEEDMVIMTLASQEFIQIKWMIEYYSGDVYQGLSIITEEDSHKGPDGDSMSTYERAQSSYDKGTDCPVIDLRL